MTASRFAVTAILARRLATDAFGVYAYSQWLIDIGFLVCTFGATGVASRYLAEYRHQPDMMVAVLRRWRPFSVALPFAAALAAGAGAWVSGMPFDAATHMILLGWGLGSGLWGMHSAALIGLQRFDLIFASNLVAAGIMLVGALFVPMAASPAPIFAVMAVATVVASLVGLRAISQASVGTEAILDLSQRRAISLYAVNIWLTALMWSLVWSRGEIPIIRSLLGDVAVAYYAVALTLYGGAVAGVMLAVSGVAPQVTRCWGEGNERAAVAICRKVMDLQLLLSGLGGLALIWLAPELMQLGFGEQYRDSALLLGILALGLPALTVSSHNHLLQIMTGARYNRNTTLLGVVLLLSLAWLCVSAFGVEGAAWSRAAVLLVLGTITAVVCWKRWGSAAIGVGNLAGVVLLSVLSVLLHSLPYFEHLLPRLFLLLILSLTLLAWVRTETKEMVVPHLVRLLWSRLRMSN
jgi:O-antigen/teichoic acid export membrane protein